MITVRRAAELGLVACMVLGCGASRNPTSAGASSGPSSASSATIGAGGGEVGVVGGASLTVPAGSLAAPALANVAQAPKPSMAPSDTWPEMPVGPTWHIDVGGASLFRPVLIRLPYDASALPTGTSPTDLTLAYRDESSGQWVAVASTVDATTHFVSAQVSHLSDWAIWAPDWDYWLAVLKAAASGRLTSTLHAISTFASGCQTSLGIYGVDNSVANRMVQGCLTDAGSDGATLEIRNLRAFALEISDPRGYLAQEPTLVMPGDSVSIKVASTDASPVVVAADMSARGLTASVVDIVLELLPGIDAAKVSPSWSQAFTDIVDGIGKLQTLSDAVSQATEGNYAQAAEAAAKVVTGVDFMTALGTLAQHAGIKYGIPALAQINEAAIAKVTAVVSLGDLIVTAWSFFGDYFFNAHTEVRLAWHTSSPSPTAPALDYGPWIQPLPNISYGAATYLPYITKISVAEESPSTVSVRVAYSYPGTPAGPLYLSVVPDNVTGAGTLSRSWKPAAVSTGSGVAVVEASTACIGLGCASTKTEKYDDLWVCLGKAAPSQPIVCRMFPYPKTWSSG